MAALSADKRLRTERPTIESVWAEPRSAAVCSMPSSRRRAPSRSSSTIPPSMRRSTRTCSTTKVVRLSAAGGGRESRLRPTPNRPARYQRAGFGEEGQPHPCRSANGNCAETSEDLTPSQGRHSDQRHRENHMIAGNGGRDSENGPDRRTQDRRPRHCESGLTDNERRCHRRQCQRAARR